MNAELPHTLILSTWDGESYDGEDFGTWDDCEITCPHQPATAGMPCGLWEPCGCQPGRVGELDHPDGLAAMSWPCPRSSIGVHRYPDTDEEYGDVPNRPIALCSAKEWELDFSRTALDLGLPAGTYAIRPWSDWDGIHFDLIDPVVVTR